MGDSLAVVDLGIGIAIPTSIATDTSSSDVPSVRSSNDPPILAFFTSRVASIHGARSWLPLPSPRFPLETEAAKT